MIKAVLVTLLLLGITALSLYAVGEGLRTGRVVHFVQAAGAMIPAVIGGRVMIAFWLDHWRNRR